MICGESTTYTSEICPNVSTSFSNSISKIVKTVRAKGMGIAASWGRIIIANTIVNEADFKEICRRVLNEDGTREVGYHLELINNKNRSHWVLLSGPGEGLRGIRYDYHQQVQRGMGDSLLSDKKYPLELRGKFGGGRLSLTVALPPMHDSWISTAVSFQILSLKLAKRRTTTISFQGQLYILACLVWRLSCLSSSWTARWATWRSIRWSRSYIEGMETGLLGQELLWALVGDCIHRQRVQSCATPASIQLYLRHGIDEQCLQQGLPIFNMQVLEAARVWENAPLDQVPVIQTDVMMDLFFLRATLMSANLAN